MAAVFKGFDKAIEVINSDVTINNTRIEKSIIAVDAHNSEVVIQDSVLLSNVIDLAVEDSKAEIINTIADKVIIDIQKYDLENKSKIIKLATEIRNTTKIKAKKKQYRQLLNTIKDIAAIASLLKAILEITGVI